MEWTNERYGLFFEVRKLRRTKADRLVQQELASASGLSRLAISQLESGATNSRISTISAVQDALEQAGVEFTNGGQPGVKPRAKG